MGAELSAGGVAAGPDLAGGRAAGCGEEEEGAGPFPPWSVTVCSPGLPVFSPPCPPSFAACLPAFAPCLPPCFCITLSPAPFVPSPLELLSAVGFGVEAEAWAEAWAGGTPAKPVVLDAAPVLDAPLPEDGPRLPCFVPWWLEGAFLFDGCEEAVEDWCEG